MVVVWIVLPSLCVLLAIIALAKGVRDPKAHARYSRVFSNPLALTMGIIAAAAYLIVVAATDNLWYAQIPLAIGIGLLISCVVDAVARRATTGISGRITKEW